MGLTVNLSYLYFYKQLGFISQSKAFCAYCSQRIQNSQSDVTSKHRVYFYSVIKYFELVSEADE